MLWGYRSGAGRLAELKYQRGVTEDGNKYVEISQMGRERGSGMRDARGRGRNLRRK